MTTYTAIPGSSIDAGSALTVTTLTRMRDNPIAISEGSAGAPKIANAAFNSNTIQLEKIDLVNGPASYDAVVSQSVSAQSYYTVTGAGFWMVICADDAGQPWSIELYDGATWRASNHNYAGGLVYAINNAAVRFKNEHGTLSQTIYLRKLV